MKYVKKLFLKLQPDYYRFICKDKSFFISIKNLMHILHQVFIYEFGINISSI